MTSFLLIMLCPVSNVIVWAYFISARRLTIKFKYNNATELTYYLLFLRTKSFLVDIQIYRRDLFDTEYRRVGPK